MPIHTVTVQSNNILSTIVGLKVARQQSLVNIQPKLSAINTFPAGSSRQLFEETKKDETVNSNRRSKVNTLKEYKSYQKTFLEILESFEKIDDGILEP